MGHPSTLSGRVIAFVKRRSSVQARLAALQIQWFGRLMARATGAVQGGKKTLYRTKPVQASDPWAALSAVTSGGFS